MATKNNPGDFDCYSRADPNEPMFVLLGRDPLAAPLVRCWASLRQLLPFPSPAKIEEARRCADAMEDWCRRIAHKEPIPLREETSELRIAGRIPTVFAKAVRFIAEFGQK